MIIWTIAYLSLLSQIFALTKVFLLEHLFFFILRCLFNYFYLMLIYLFIHSFAPLLLCFLICSFYLFILSLACIFIYLCIYRILIHSFSYSYCILSSSTPSLFFTFLYCLVKHKFYFNNKFSAKRSIWRMSLDLGLSSLFNLRYFDNKYNERGSIWRMSFCTWIIPIPDVCLVILGYPTI